MAARDMSSTGMMPSFMRHFQFSTKFMSGFGALLVVLLAVSGFGYLGLVTVNDDLDRYAESVNEAALIGHIETTFLEMTGHAQRFAGDNDPAEAQAVFDLADKIDALTGEALREQLNAVQEGKLRALAGQIKSYVVFFKDAAKSNEELEFLVRGRLDINGEAIVSRVSDLFATPEARNDPAFVRRLADIRRHALSARLLANMQMLRNDSELEAQADASMRQLQDAIQSTRQEASNSELQSKLTDIHNLTLEYAAVLDEIRLKADELHQTRDVRMADLVQVIASDIGLLQAEFAKAEDKLRNETLAGIKLAETEMLVAALAGILISIYVAFRREAESLQELQSINDDLRAHIQRRELAEKNLEYSIRNLQRSNAELETFAYVASHDLQEPLRKVRAFGDLLQAEYEDKLGEEGAGYIKRMQNAAERMSLLINDLLSLSRVATKGNPFTETDLNKVVSSVINDLEVVINETGAEIEIGALPQIEADQIQMRQLFQNLIANAIKFRRDDATPIISIHHVAEAINEGMCRIDVEDNGVGFEPEHEDRIFNLFQRLHGRSERPGSGVGLAICRKICDRHNGSIVAKGRPGSGATFILSLPFKHLDKEQTL